MERMLRPHRARSGIALGWLLGALALITVVVIVVILVWQPGASPADEDETAPPAAEGEAPADGAEEGAEPEEAAEPEDAEEDGAAAAEAEDADEAPAEGEAAEGEAPEGEAPAEGETAEDPEAEESPGPVDATVETGDEVEDVELQAEAESREVDAGNQVADAVGSIVSATEDAESRIEGLEAAEVGQAEPGEPLRVDGSGEDAQARVMDAQMGDGPDVAGAREAAEASATSEAEAEQGPARTSLPAREATRDEPEQARTRTAEVQDASTGLLERIRSSVPSAQRAERPSAERASVNLRDGASQPAADSESRTITLQPIDTSGALDRAHPGVEAAE